MTETLASVAGTVSRDGQAAHADHGQKRSRHRPPKRALAVVVVLILAGAAAYWLLRAQPTTSGLTASGTIELQEGTLPAETSRRIAELSVHEGSTVLERQVRRRPTHPLLAV